MHKQTDCPPGTNAAAVTARTQAVSALLLVGACVLLSGCQSAPVKPPAEQLDEQFAACSTQYAYQAGEMESSLGPHELAPEERAWRDCVYKAVETSVVPRMNLGDRVKEIIAADRTMTNEIEAGTLTRAERSDRIDKMLTALFNDEELARRDQAARVDAMMSADLDRMRDMRRQEDMMRRRMSPRI